MESKQTNNYHSTGKRREQRAMRENRRSSRRKLDTGRLVGMIFKFPVHGAISGEKRKDPTGLFLSPLMLCVICFYFPFFPPAENAICL